jgi:hypothetical protein
MFTFGDRVLCDLTSHGGSPEEFFVLGTMAYGGDAILVGDNASLGMPVNIGHCKLVDGQHFEICRRLRERYLARFPSTLIPIAQ